MIERIKEFFKDSANTIIVLLATIGGAVIYYLEKSLDKANYRAGQLEADKALGDVISKKVEAANEADRAEEEYNNIRDAYESGPVPKPSTDDKPKA